MKKIKVAMASFKLNEKKKVPLKIMVLIERNTRKCLLEGGLIFTRELEIFPKKVEA